MQISRILLVLSATAASLATPVENTDQAAFEAVAAKYNIELTEAGASDFETMAAKKCYGGGPKWGGERDYVLDRAGRWCSGNGGAERYRRGQKKSGCYNFGGNRANFNIQNLQDKDIDLSSEACFRFMRGLINGCDRGGANGNGAWQWGADANYGRC